MPNIETDGDFLRNVSDNATNLTPYCDDEDVARLRAIAARLDSTRPIPVEERLPEVGQRVLVHADDRWGADVGGWHSARFASDDRATDQSSRNGGFQAVAGPCRWRVKEITHWLPVPPIPAL